MLGAARRALEVSRGAVAGGGAVPGVDELAARVAGELDGRWAARTRAVVNATGVVLHTNLGRAPLSAAARAAVAEAAGYAAVEYDLAAGTRGRRGAAAEALLREATGAEAALAVNNAAGALLLALGGLARGREVLVSRGELIEIGGEFRLPQIMEAAGVVLREVGTTNRTHLRDYAAGFGPETGLVLAVHPSNYRVEGFATRPALDELAALAHEHGLALLHDVGSGLLAGELGDEPSVSGSLRAGADLVLFSGDKLLGGPQAGLVVGRAELVGRLARHPLARAVRADKLTLAALEATLAAHLAGRRDELPVWRSLLLTVADLEPRAAALARPSGRPRPCAPGPAWPAAAASPGRAWRASWSRSTRPRTGRRRCWPACAPATLRWWPGPSGAGSCWISAPSPRAGRPGGEGAGRGARVAARPGRVAAGCPGPLPALMPHVIGTAGHVDHGKSALIQALTGTDPDRLAEEKARGLTIDLGFAWTTLPSGREVGFVDVPGHERFVHNMLAGVGGVGCALFVVDASEGWRPQSAEHLAILDLLGIPSGVVALTKVDLVDQATRDRVAAEVRDRLRGTTLAGAAVVPTAAPSGLGVDALATALDAALDRLPEPPDRGRPRVPVDRVFTMRGSGTVVTGTLSGGSLRADGEAELLPSGRRVRVRGLQGHGRPLEMAAPARRVAVNLAGVATGQVDRGEVLVLGGQWAATGTVDCRLRCLPGAPAPLRGRGAYLVYAGAAESAARLQPLDAAEVRPGGDALVRLHLERPMVLDVFEPLVLRDSGRDETVGGGLVLDPFPPAAVRGTAARVRRTEELEAREAAGRDGLLERVLAERGVVPLSDLPRLAAIAPDRLPAALAGGPGVRGPGGSGGPPGWSPGGPGGGAVVRSRTLAWTRDAWEAAAAAVLEAVEGQHREDPSAPGLPAQAARAAAGLPADPARPGWPASAGNELVEALLADGRLVADGPTLRRPGHGVRLDPAQRALRARVEAALAEAGVGLLGDSALAELGADRKATALLVRLGVLVAVAPGGYLGHSALEAAVATLRRSFPDGRPFAATEAKEALGTTRRTAIPLLEHLDRTGVTVRQGDLRRLAPPGRRAP